MWSIIVQIELVCQGLIWGNLGEKGVLGEGFGARGRGRIGIAAFC